MTQTLDQLRKVILGDKLYNQCLSEQIGASEKELKGRLLYLQHNDGCLQDCSFDDFKKLVCLRQNDGSKCSQNLNTQQTCVQNRMKPILDERSKDICSICLDSDPNVIICEAGHMVHTECLEQSLKNNKTECPMCRKQMFFQPVQPVQPIRRYNMEQLLEQARVQSEHSDRVVDAIERGDENLALQLVRQQTPIATFSGYEDNVLGLALKNNMMQVVNHLLQTDYKIDRRDLSRAIQYDPNNIEMIKRVLNSVGPNITRKLNFDPLRMIIFKEAMDENNKLDLIRWVVDSPNYILEQLYVNNVRFIYRTESLIGRLQTMKLTSVNPRKIDELIDHIRSKLQLQNN